MAERKTDAKKQAESASFETALERLETLVGEMEEGKLGLETLIARFEEGQKLIAFCSKKLNEVERRIETLVKKGDRLEAEPFDPSAPEPAPEPTAEPDDAPF